ncbi:uracil-DNA glycosylase family protein [Rhizobium sp. BK176]|uniref:uracil-DNA glycosylase family protein n=1 Tax=Rhizobium sp. BK176 TaxID=2587071 RepID=UPI00216A78E8|nr:uracil-DNA glycosylase family protein [Rhizobium sp. BK176]MCS4088969.1 hypothetical protein [Rhizobium sp. BK176]
MGIDGLRGGRSAGMDNIPDPLDFLRRIETMSASDIAREVKKPSALLMERAAARQGELEVAYAPFDHVNGSARVVIVGITPGRTQMEAAINAAKSGYLMKLPEEKILERAKVHASFSGDMRPDLVALLDFIGMPRVLGVGSTNELWGRAASLVHFTSALRYPTFFNGENYNGTPRVGSDPLLQRHVKAWFGAEVAALKDAIFVLLGGKVEDFVLPVLQAGGVPDGRIIRGFFHPSGANRERVKYFLGTLGKPPSVKVDREKTDRNREEIIAKVSAL